MKTSKLPLTHSLLLTGLALAFLAIVVPTAHAASGTWTQPASNGLWSATGNWSGGIVADGADSVADFSTIDITADNGVHLDSSRTIGLLKTGDTATGTAASWIFDNNANGANILTLAVSSGIPTITNSSLGTAKTVTISAALAGTQGLFKTGAGNLVLGNKTNSYTGDTIINAGNLQVAGALGSGNYSGNITMTNGGFLTFNSSVAQTLGGVIGGTGTLSKNGANSVTLSVANTFSGNTTLATNSTGALVLNHNLALQNSALNVLVGGTKVSTLTLGAGVTTPTLGGLIGSADLASVITTNYNLCTALTLNPSSSCSYTGVVANGASGMTLTKTGAGTQTLLGANTYSGDTTISAGTLKLDTSGALANTPNITVASGATFDVSASTLTTALTLGSGQTLKASATGGNTTGTITVGSGKNLTLSAGGLAFTVYGGGATAPLTLAGTAGALAMNSAPVIVTTTVALANGPYTLVAKGTPTVTGTLGTLTVNGAASPSWASVAVTSGQLILTITGGMPTITAPANFPAALTGAVGTPSSPTSVAISGSGLTAGITATAPNSNLEVSSDNITYGSTATFTTSGGTLYVRLSASAAAGIYNSLNVVLSSAGAVSVNVATTASGNVVANPYWTLAASGNWGTAGNWYGGGIPNGSGKTADFSQVSITSDTTVHLDSTYTVSNLIFGNTNVTPSANWILDNNGNSGNTLTLAGGTPTVTVTNLGTGKSATISAEIDGTAGLTKIGNGTLTLSSANNAYSGGTTVSAGTLALSGSGTLGSTSGALTLSGGKLDLGGETTPTVGAVSITAAATSGNTITNGTLTCSSFTANITSGTATVSAALTISGNATNSGAGTLALSGAGTNTVSSLKTTAGGLTLSSGTLNVTASGTPQANGLWINGGTVTVAGGTLTANTGSFATINGGGTLAVSSGTANIAGVELLLGYGSTAGTVTVSGTGTLNVPALRVSQTTGTGTVNLNGGTLQMNYFNDTGAGGTVNFNGGTVQAKTATSAFTFVTNVITYKVQAGGAIFDSQTYSITVGSPLVHDSALGGTLDGGLTKNGLGTLTLTNANTYTGNTTINAGNLQGVVGGSSANSTVILNASTATNGVLVADNTKSWTCAALTTTAAGVLQFNFGVTPSTTLAPFVVTGAATFTATPTVSIVGSLPAGVGTYPLMTWGSYSGTVPSLVTATTSSGFAATLSNSPTTLYLVVIPIPVASFTVIPAATNLVANGAFSQAASAVQGAGATANIFNITGSFGDYSAFWGSTATVTGWSPYHSDPYGLTTNVNPFINDPSYILNGTYYLDTLVDTNQHSITLNSGGSYLNGLIQTNILNGVTIKSGAIYQFVVDPYQANLTVNNSNSTFTAALTVGSGVNATNTATAVSGSLFSIWAKNLPTTTGVYQTNTISGANLIAAQSSGPVNMIFNQINTNGIVGYPNSSPNPLEPSQVSQLRLYHIMLTVVSPTNDLNHDGVVDQNDVNLAQTYLVGNGGDSATNRENTLINTYGFTTNQALVYLNLTSFDINGNGYFDAADVAALQAMVVVTPPTLNYTVVAPGQIQFNWSGAFKLQWLTNTLSVGLQTNVSNGWVNYPNTNNPVTVTNNQTIPSAFFRLSQ